MAKIIKGEKRGRPGVFMVDFRDHAGVRRNRTFGTKREAEDFLTTVLRERRNTTRPSVDPQITFAEYAEQWLRLVKPSLKQRSGEVYEQRLSGHVVPAFGPLKVRPNCSQPVQPCDSDVLVDHDLRPQQLGGDSRLVKDRTIRGTGGHHCDQAPRFGSRPRHPYGARPYILLRVRRDRADRRSDLLIRAGDESRARPRVEHGFDDLGYLARGLPLSEHGLRRALPQLPVQIDTRKPQVAVCEGREPLQPIRWGDLAPLDGLEQSYQFAPQPRHDWDYRIGTERDRVARRHAIRSLEGSDLP